MATISTSKALNEALQEEMVRDDRVFVLGEDVKDSAYGVTAGLYDQFGRSRVIGTPISEAAIAGAAVGAAAVGARPVAEIMYMTFLTIAMDQLVNQAAKMKYMFGGKARLPLVIRTMAGAGRGNAAQHCSYLESWFCHVPGIKVVLPSTPADAKGLLKTAIRDDNPVLLIENKVQYAETGEVSDDPNLVIPFGEAAVRREGSDVTVVALQRCVGMALEAAEAAASEGVDVEVIDPRTLVPLDLDTILNSVQKTHNVVVVHEAVERCGFGAELVAQVQENVFDYLDGPVLRVANPNVHVPFSANLEAASIPSPDQILDAIYRTIR